MSFSLDFIRYLSLGTLSEPLANAVQIECCKGLLLAFLFAPAQDWNGLHSFNVIGQLLKNLHFPLLLFKEKNGGSWFTVFSVFVIVGKMPHVDIKVDGLGIWGTICEAEKWIPLWFDGRQTQISCLSCRGSLGSDHLEVWAKGRSHWDDFNSIKRHKNGQKGAKKVFHGNSYKQAVAPCYKIFWGESW